MSPGVRGMGTEAALPRRSYIAPLPSLPFSGSATGLPAGGPRALRRRARPITRASQ